MNLPKCALSLCLLFLATPLCRAQSLDTAPPNTWVRLDESQTGGLASPMFFYAPKLKRFVLTAGRPGGSYAKAKLHYSTEHFDLAERAWSNAYPEGAPYQNAQGVTDAHEPKGKGWLGKDAQGILRPRRFGSAYGTCSRAHHQWAFDPEGNRLFAHLFKQTVLYDAAKREWQDLGAEPFEKGGFAMVWGSLCYDPLNDEVLSIGGSSNEPGGTPGTHVYKIKENKWERIPQGSEALRKLAERATALRRGSWALLSRARNRFHLAEREAEAKMDLEALRAQLAQEAEALASETAAAGLKDGHAKSAERAVQRLREAKDAYAALAGQLAAAVSVDLLAALREIHDTCWRAERALDAEPFGRAHAPLVYLPERKEILLFGGSHLDRAVNDTWIYDCATRSWSQRWPDTAPSPRAGAALAYLPKSKHVALAGGYTLDGWFRDLPDELWAYDPAAHAWKLLKALPALGKNQPANAPAGEAHGESYGGASSPWLAAATEDDVLVSIATGGEGRSTWAAKIDPAQFDEAGTREKGVAPLAMRFTSAPLDFDRKAAPDAEKMKAFYDGLQPNVWTAAPAVPMKPAWRAWNTSTYDYDRQQWLWWGGGHVTYMGTEVAHYSVRGGNWSIGYNPDAPHAPTGGFYVKASLSFMDRPQVPVHAYQAYAYDPPSGKMFMLHHAYDVAERQWDARPAAGLQSKGAMRTLVETTPLGVYALSENGLYRFDAQANEWKEQPWNGPKFGAAWCDGHALCYDRERDCLWAAHGEIFKYDLKTGQVEKLEAARPKVLGKFALWREQCVIEGSNLILLMRRFKQPGGGLRNVAFDIEQKKYYWIDLPFPGKNDQNFSWSEAMIYEPKLKVVLLHASKASAGSLFALKFDRASAKLEEIKD